MPHEKRPGIAPNRRRNGEFSRPSHFRINSGVAGCRPGIRHARCNESGVGERRLQCGRVPAFDEGDPAAISRQEPSRGDADDTAAKHRYVSCICHSGYLSGIHPV